MFSLGCVNLRGASGADSPSVGTGGQKKVFDGVVVRFLARDAASEPPSTRTSRARPRSADVERSACPLPLICMSET